LPSTTHRVINPTNDSSARFSMPFFVHPHSNASLKCIPSCVGTEAKYAEITAGDFLKQRLKEIGLY
jgi:isopenicillin N synthase-like dioxygenase